MVEWMILCAEIRETNRKESLQHQRENKQQNMCILRCSYICVLMAFAFYRQFYAV